MGLGKFIKRTVRSVGKFVGGGFSKWQPLKQPTKIFSTNPMLKSAVQYGSGGLYDPSKNRFFVPFSSGWARNFAEPIANMSTAGTQHKQIGDLKNKETVKTAGAVAGALAAAAAGAGGASLMSGAGSAAGAGGGLAQGANAAGTVGGAAAGSAGGTVGVTGAGLGAGAGAAGTAGGAAGAGAGAAASGGSSLLTNSLLAAGALTGLAGMIQKPEAPPQPELPQELMPEERQVQQQLEASDAEDEARRRAVVKTPRTNRTGARGAEDYGRNSYAPSLIGNNDYLKSVLG